MHSDTVVNVSGALGTGAVSRGAVLARAGITLLLLLLVCGCEQRPLAYDLSQTQAYQVVAALAQEQIEAEIQRETGGRGKFSVKVAADDFGRAVQLLQSKGLPEVERVGMDQLLAPQGLLPSSRDTEALRLDYALAGQVEALLRNDPAIVSARVMVRRHSRKEGENTAVSAVVQQRAGTTLDIEQLRGVLQQTIPGVAPEQVSVVVKEVTAPAVLDATSEQNRLVPFLVFWRIPANQYSGIAIAFASLFLLVGGCALGVGFFAGRHAARNEQARVALPSSSERAPLRIGRTEEGER